MNDYEAALERIRELIAERDGALARVAELEAVIGAMDKGPARLRRVEDEARLTGGEKAA